MMPTSPSAAAARVSMRGPTDLPEMLSFAAGAESTLKSASVSLSHSKRSSAEASPSIGAIDR